VPRRFEAISGRKTLLRFIDDDGAGEQCEAGNHLLLESREIPVYGCRHGLSDSDVDSPA
jgi:hypothetical protein